MPTPGSRYPSRSGRRPPDRLWFHHAESLSPPMLIAGCPIVAQSHSPKGSVVAEPPSQWQISDQGTFRASLNSKDRWRFDADSIAISESVLGSISPSRLLVIPLNAGLLVQVCRRDFTELCLRQCRCDPSAQSLYRGKTPYVGGIRRPGPRVKERSVCRVIFHVHVRRLDGPSDGRVTAVLPV